MTCQANGLCVKVTIRGAHGVLAKPQGGSLWTVTEWLAIEEAVRGAQKIGVKEIREALTKRGMTVRCTPRQLSNFADRMSMKTLGSSKTTKAQACTVGELQAAASQFQACEPVPWANLAKAQLVILPQSICDTERVCVLWTSPGMVQCAKGAQKKIVKLVVDGKQNVMRNHYTIMTLSFYVTSQKLQKTWAGKLHKSSAEFWTGTQVPFVQALMNTESEANVALLFQTAVEIGSTHCGLDLEKQVRQVHKDHARGIEAARRRVFKYSRPCDDFAHMRRQSYPKLKQMLGVHRPSWGAQVHANVQMQMNAKILRSKKAAVRDETHPYEKRTRWPQPTNVLLPDVDSYLLW